MKRFYQNIFIICLTAFPQLLVSQITVTTGTPVTTLVQNVLVGQGVTVSNITYTGHPNAIGHFQTGSTPSNLGISEGIVISSGLVNNPSAPIGSPPSNHASTSHSLGGDPLLTALAGYTTYDAAILEFDFVPQSDTIRFRYVFGSEEYHDFVDGTVNDAFGFFISGPNPLGGVYTNRNMALIPGTNIPITINTVNNGYTYNPCSSGPCMNCAYFVDNCMGTTVVYDAFTVVLTAWASVIPCMTYHLKIGIADAGDWIYDSGVFLEANSLTTNAVALNISPSLPAAGNDAIEGCNNVVIDFTLPAPTPVNRVVPFTIGGTAINGVDYQTIPNSVTIPAGQSSTTLTIEPIYDAIPEPTETVVLIVQTSPCISETVTINILDYTALSATGTGSTDFCTGGGTAVIGVTPSDGLSPYEFNWSSGLSPNQSHTVSPTMTTTYTVTVTDVCGHTATDDITITIHPDPVIDISPQDPTICLGATQTLIASGGINYNWSSGQNTETINVAPTTTTSYTVTGSDNFGCSGTADVTVYVFPNLTVNITPPAPVICDGDSIQLTVTSNGTVPEYTWSTGENNTSIIVAPQITTDYIVDVIDSVGCTGSSTVTVTVNPIPFVGFEGNPIDGCVPVNVGFTNLSDQGAMLWEFGDGATSVNVHPSHLYSNSGIFSVTLTVTEAGCVNSLTKPQMIHVYPKTVAGFHPSDLIVYEDEAYVKFTDMSYGATTWFWDFGTGDGGAVSFEQNPEFTFPGIGQYTVWQFVENQWGCRDSISKVIVVKQMVTFYVPNAFTPNEDGINDVFMPFGNNINPDAYEFIVFNRWGKEVFKTNNINIPWDGTSSEFEGKVAPSGVYLYYIKASFEGVIKEFSGFFTLIK